MLARSMSFDPAIETVAGRHVNWHDTAAVPIGPGDTAELARNCFEGAPRWLRAFLIVGWRLLLLDGPNRSDAGYVLGWPVTVLGDAVVLRRRSGLGLISTLVFTRSDQPVGRGSLVLSTAVVHTGVAARVLWPLVAPVHRWTIRYTLSRLARRWDRRTTGHSPSSV